MTPVAGDKGHINEPVDVNAFRVCVSVCRCRVFLVNEVKSQWTTIR